MVASTADDVAIQNGRTLAAKYASLEEFPDLVYYARDFSHHHIPIKADQKLSFFINICFDASPKAAFLEHIGLKGIQPLPIAFKDRGVVVPAEILSDLSEIPVIIGELTDKIGQSDPPKRKRMETLKERAAILVESSDFKEFAKDEAAKRESKSIARPR